jgi:nucleotide-binding universal stress UspA family protein
MSVIVVGVDHSAGAKEALCFALDEARLRPATLRAVHAWQYASIGWSPVGDELHELRDTAAAALDPTLQEAIPETAGDEVERRVQGAPAAVLVEELGDADLLVVGSRGLGGFAQLLLGSVSQRCDHHAECPVVIVRPRSDKE